MHSFVKQIHASNACKMKFHIFISHIHFTWRWMNPSICGTAQLTLDTCFGLLTSVHRLYLSHLSMLACYLHVTLVILWIWLTSDRIWHLLEHFMSLHTNLLTSSSEGMQTQELIPGTCDFLINSFIVYRYKHW